MAETPRTNQEPAGAGWPADDWPGFVARWHEACAADAVLATWAGPWSLRFGIGSGARFAAFGFEDGRMPPARAGATDPAAPVEFALSAPEAVWARFLAPVPPRHHHAVFAMLMRVPEFALRGDPLRFAQSCHVVRRVLEVGKWLALGHALPVPTSLRPSLRERGENSVVPPAAVTGAYAQVPVNGTAYWIYQEWTGSGRDLLCLHTAGADGRQFHRLMADPRIAGGHRLVAFDLPWHGKSPPPAGAVPGSWRLSTDLYVALIMGFVAAARLERPIVLGASMSGEICLELAYRHPEAFSAIVACEASDKVEGRRVPWASHPQVNQTIFVPEWIHGLMAPQSPAECAEEIWWQYSQGGCATFAGDIEFYSGEWDARDRVSRIDTRRCPLFMLTGEYDYSCTAERSAETAARIPGARYETMPGLGHFPFAENPGLFASHLLPILREIGGASS
jgi:pimeloyl-ACP methyl ester carboxylesterase